MMAFTPYIHSDYVNESKIYYPDENNALNESNTYTWKITNGYVIHQRIHITSPSFIRFDPANKPCKCKLLEIIIDGKKVSKDKLCSNRILANENYDYFMSHDSNYMIDVNVEKDIQIQYIVYPLTFEDMEYITKEKNKEINALEFKYEQLYDKTHPVSKMNKKIKARLQ